VLDAHLSDYRELAGVYPDRYRSYLAFSLHNLGVTFSKLGRHDEATNVWLETEALREGS